MVILLLRGWARGQLLTLKETVCYEMLDKTTDLEGFCEHDTEHPGSIGGEFLDCLSNCQLLKKEPVSWT
jgi:hypothetical protein